MSSDSEECAAENGGEKQHTASLSSSPSKSRSPQELRHGKSSSPCSSVNREDPIDKDEMDFEQTKSIANQSKGRSKSREKSNNEKIRKKSRSKSRDRASKKKSSRRSRSLSSSRRHSRSRRHRSRSDRRSRSRGRRRSSSRSQRRSRSRSLTPADDARLHVAELDVDTRKRDLEKVFEKYGRVREIWMARNPPCFAFVVYYHQRDADQALNETDGILIGHCRIKVTHARPRVRGGRFRSSYDPNLRCYQCGELEHFSRNCTDTKFGYKRPPTPPGSYRSSARTRRSWSRGRRSRS